MVEYSTIVEIILVVVEEVVVTGIIVVLLVKAEELIADPTVVALLSQNDIMNVEASSFIFVWVPWHAYWFVPHVTEQFCPAGQGFGSHAFSC